MYNILNLKIVYLLYYTAVLCMYKKNLNDILFNIIVSVNENYFDSINFVCPWPEDYSISNSI